MKSRWTIALIVAVAATSSFAAEESLWRPEFVKINSAADKLAAYPKEALDQKISGEVSLACVAAADGRLVDCKVTEEDPVGRGFGAAALALVQNERIRPRDASGSSVAGRPVTSFFPFLAPGDRNPDWVKKPRPDDLAAVYPVAAIEQGIDGRATIRCDVTVEGFLEACVAVSEYPVGIGFGAAAVQLSPQLRMSPKIRNGKPVRGLVVIPINWQDIELMKDTSKKPASKKLILDPAWVSTPSAAAVQAAWPKNAKGVSTAQVALRCAFSPEGALRRCEPISEIPAQQGFAKGAKELAQTFRVRFTPEEAKTLKDYLVDVPFRFRAPGQDDTRAITQPKWISQIAPESVEKVFPKAARDAGIMSGLGVVRCVVSPAGDLNNCEVLREDPVGLGFGAAATQAAVGMRMNPWSKEGDPLDGLKVTVPIRLVTGPAEPPTPAATAP